MVKNLVDIYINCAMMENDDDDTKIEGMVKERKCFKVKL